MSIVHKKILKHRFNQALLCATAISAISLISVAVHAEEKLEEITVTALRRTTDVQHTPIAVTAIQGDVLANQLDANLFDAVAQLPGVSLNGTAGYGNFPIGVRGIASSTSSVGSDDPVAVYLDGVYLGKPSAVMADLNNVSEIQVIRGPQGSLYGRNATAGAVLITHSEPQDSLHVNGNISYGSFGRWRASGGVEGPLAGAGLRGSLQVSSTDSKGWGNNSYNNSDVVGRRGTSGVGTLLLEHDGLKAVLRVDYLNERVRDGFKKLNAIPYNVATPLIADNSLLGNDSQFSFNTPSSYKRTDGGFSLNVEDNLGDVTLHSTTGWRYDNLVGGIDTDGTAANINTNATDERYHQFTQSIFLTGENSEGNWIVGVDGYSGQTEVTQTVGLVPASSALTIYGDADVNSLAAFAEYTRKFTDALSLTVGGRVNYDNKRFISRGAAVGVFPATPEFTVSKSWTSVTPSARLSYTPINDLMFYASVTEGFKSGGYTALQITPFNPEKAWNYEVGAKWTSADKKFRLASDVFYTKYKNLQVRVSEGLGIIQTLNAASATIKGAELEAAWVPIHDWRISGFANYVDAKYDRYIGAYNYDNSGQTLNRAPKWQLGGTLNYAKNIGGFGIVTAEGIYSYRSMIYLGAPNVSGVSSPAYSNFDARLGYESENSQWTVSVVGKNLSDSRHINNVMIFGPNLVASFNEPRSFQVQLGYKY